MFKILKAQIQTFDMKAQLFMMQKKLSRVELFIRVVINKFSKWDLNIPLGHKRFQF